MTWSLSDCCKSQVRRDLQGPGLQAHIWLQKTQRIPPRVRHLGTAVPEPTQCQPTSTPSYLPWPWVMENWGNRRLAGSCWSVVGRWYVDGTRCLPILFPKGPPKVQVAGKSPLVLLLLLLLLAAATTEYPVRASSSPIALFFLLSLPQPHPPLFASPHLYSPCPPRLAQLLDLLQYLVELSVRTSGAILSVALPSSSHIQKEDMR